MSEPITVTHHVRPLDPEAALSELNKALASLSTAYVASAQAGDSSRCNYLQDDMKLLTAAIRAHATAVTTPKPASS